MTAERKRPEMTKMSKDRQKSNKEVRKPKKAKEKTNASNPSVKTGSVMGVDTKRR